MKRGCCDAGHWLELCRTMEVCGRARVGQSVQTVSYYVVKIISIMTPIHLMAEERAEITATIARWKRLSDESSKGPWTCLIPGGLSASLQAGGQRLMSGMPAQRRRRGACIFSLLTFLRKMEDPEATPSTGTNSREHHWGDVGKWVHQESGVGICSKSNREAEKRRSLEE
ncbi:hypothetical protein J6590_070777 [Homalodisca vitripennis]|nr:hypothetical protein J6590_070777 [Homalodisca vitripennis]